MPDERIIHLPYVVIDAADGNEYGISKITTFLNIQMDIKNTNAVFGKPKNLPIKPTERLVIYGNAGCGKTRCLVEIIRSLRPARVFIINPSEAQDGPIKRAYLAKIVSECREGDLIVWDNFPDGLEQADEEVARLVIKMLSYGRGKFVVTLNQEYVGREGLRTIEDLGIKLVHLKYTQNEIQKILASSARKVLPKELFAMIEDDLSEIARRIWQAEPTPKMVFDYLQGLVADPSVALWSEYPATLALKSQNHLEYYRRQFTILKEKPGCRDEAEFLYTVKICYELGLDRKLTSLIELQKMIFGSSANKRILQRLSPWFYMLGDQVSLHDIVRQSISLDEEAVMKTISFISSYKEKLNEINDQSVYLLGSFVGRNCSIAPKKDFFKLLPEMDMEKDIRSRRFYQIGLGHGIGRTIMHLTPNERNRIFRAARTNNQFERNLGEGMGWEMMKMPASVHKIMFRYAKKSLIFSRGFGLGVGMTLPHLSSRIKKEMFLQAEANVQFADGLGIGVGAIIEFLPDDIHTWLFWMAESNAEFARGLGTGIGHYFVSLSDRIQLYALTLIKNNSQFARGLGIGLGDIFAYLPEGLKKEALHHAKKNREFAAGLGVGTGYSFSYMSPALQRQVLALCGKNPSFAYGAGLGIGVTFYYLADDVKRRMLDISQNNQYFAIGLGDGYGLSYPTIPPRFQKEILSRTHTNQYIALGFGMGTGYGFGYFTHSWRKKFLALAKTNREYAEGLGFGLGRTFKLQNKNLRASILSKMLSNISMALGIGQGLGSEIEYLSREREEIFRIAATHNAFAYGLGKGIGATLNYCSENLEIQIFKESGSNLNIAKGILEALEKVWPYLDRTERKELRKFIDSASLIDRKENS